MSFPKTVNHNGTKPYLRRKRVWLGLFLMSLILLLASCSTTRTILQTAPSTPKGAAALPALIISDQETWEATTKPVLKDALQSQIYGRFPENLHLNLIRSTQTDGLSFDDTAKISVDTLSLQNTLNGETSEFDLVIVTPNTDQPVRALIMMQSFCPVEDVVPQADFPNTRTHEFSCQGDGFLNSVFGYFFGRYIVSPPIKMLIERGYAFAVMYPPDFIPDSSERGMAHLSRFFSTQAAETRTRAVMAWAAQFSLTSDYLKTKIPDLKTIAYGHSRYGKTALVAGAFNENIDAVIAHQSGTGGASLNRDKAGETVSDISEQFPHWFLERYTDAPQEFDQHHLLALTAPRPFLLGNAKRDVWSDPEGAFRAAQGSNPAYAIYGKTGLSSKELTTFIPDDDIAFWIRPGTHGVVEEDWPAFLEFLDAHFTGETPSSR